MSSTEDLLDNCGYRINMRLKTSGGVLVKLENGEEKLIKTYEFFDIVNTFLLTHIAKVSSRLRCEKKLLVLAEPKYLPSQVNMVLPEEDPDDIGEQDDAEEGESPKILPPMTFAKAAYLDRQKMIEQNKDVMVQLQVLSTFLCSCSTAGMHFRLLFSCFCRKTVSPFGTSCRRVENGSHAQPPQPKNVLTSRPIFVTCPTLAVLRRNESTKRRTQLQLCLRSRSVRSYTIICNFFLLS